MSIASARAHIAAGGMKDTYSDLTSSDGEILRDLNVEGLPSDLLSAFLHDPDIRMAMMRYMKERRDTANRPGHTTRSEKKRSRHDMEHHSESSDETVSPGATTA